MGSSSDDKPQRISYVGTYNMPLLLEELCDAFDWVSKVTAYLNGVKITFPKAVPKAKVDAIVKAHNPNSLSKNEKNKKIKEKLRKAGKKKLKDLGLTQAEVDAIIGTN